MLPFGSHQAPRRRSIAAEPAKGYPQTGVKIQKVLIHALGPLGFDSSQHTPTPRPSVERTAEKTILLSDRVSLSSAEAREEGVQGEYPTR